MKKILITGGTGFIGRNLIEQLIGYYDISSPSSTDLDLTNDVHVHQFIKEHQFDVIIHTATWNATETSTKDLTKVTKNNLRMFINLARCSKYFGKMIYYGSGAEFDRKHWKPRMKEEDFDQHVPDDDYGFSKYIMCQYTYRVSHIYNLRLFGVFGKYEDWRIRFISNACAKAVFDLPITIRQNVFFDYLYIEDLIAITKWFIENNPKQRIMNVCTGMTYDLLGLAKKVIIASGKNLPVFVSQQGLGREYSGDNSILLEALGGFEFKPIDKSIRELYEWYLNNKNIINLGQISIG